MVLAAPYSGTRASRGPTYPPRLRGGWGKGAGTTPAVPGRDGRKRQDRYANRFASDGPRLPVIEHETARNGKTGDHHRPMRWGVDLAPPPPRRHKGHFRVTPQSPPPSPACLSEKWSPGEIVNVAATRCRIVPATSAVALRGHCGPPLGRRDSHCERTKFAHLPLAVRISMLTSWRRNPMLCVPRSGTSPDYRAGQAFHRRRSIGRHCSV
jgi:hypothetical protein